MLKPAAVTGFGDWKWQECPVSLTDVRAVVTLREHAQTDTVNPPTIHWLTPLGTHSVHVSHCVDKSMSIYLFSLKAHDDTSVGFAHLFWSVLIKLVPGSEIPLQLNSPLYIQYFCYNQGKPSSYGGPSLWWQKEEEKGREEETQCTWRCRSKRVRGLCAAMKTATPVDTKNVLMASNQQPTSGERSWKHATMSGCILYPSSLVLHLHDWVNRNE